MTDHDAITTPAGWASTLPQRVLADVLCTALEGGVAYWVDSVECTRYDGDGVLAAPGATADLGDGPEVVGDITRDTIRLGLTRILSEECPAPHTRDSLLPYYLGGGDVEDLACDLDADDADNIVQAGIFGRPVFC